MFESMPSLSLLGISVLFVLSVVDISFPEEKETLFDLAGYRVRKCADKIHVAPNPQELLVATAVCVLLVWFGVRQIAHAMTHVSAAHGLTPPPLGGVSFSLGGGFTLIGTTSMALGCAGLFRTSFTSTVTLDGSSLYLRRMWMSCITLAYRSIPLSEVQCFKVRTQKTSPPLVELSVYRKGRDPFAVLSQVPSVGAARRLRKKLRRISKLLNEWISTPEGILEILQETPQRRVWKGKVASLGRPTLRAGRKIKGTTS